MWKYMKRCNKDYTEEEFLRQYRGKRHDIAFPISPALLEWGEDSRSRRDIITALAFLCHWNRKTGVLHVGELEVMLLLGCAPKTAVDAKKRLLRTGLLIHLGGLYYRQGLMDYGMGKPKQLPVFLFTSGIFSMLGGPLQKAFSKMAICDGIAAPNAVRSVFMSWENRCDQFTRQCIRPEDRCLNQETLRFLPAEKLKRYSKKSRDALEKMGLLVPTGKFLSGPVEPGSILIMNPISPPPGYADFMRKKFLPRVEKYELLKQADRDRRAARSGLLYQP